MYNQMIFNQLMEKHSKEDVLKYAILHSEVCSFVCDFQIANKANFEQFADASYDAYWWKNKIKELQDGEDNTAVSEDNGINQRIHVQQVQTDIGQEFTF
jgi:hypothetical protein